MTYFDKTNSSKQTYIIHNELNNLFAIKLNDEINISLDKLKTLNKKLPLDLVGYLRSDIKTELHRIFKDKNEHGDWFSLSKDDLIKINKFPTYVAVNKLKSKGM